MVGRKIPDAINAGGDFVVARLVKRVEMIGSRLIVGHEAAALFLIEGVKEADRSALAPVGKHHAVVKIDKV